MARFRNQFQRRSGSRPNRSWAGDTSSTFFSLAAATSVISSGFVASGGDQTVLRVVGILSIASDQAGAVEDQIGAMGMILVSDSAFAAGIASLPDPITDQDNDGWFMYQAFASQGDASVTSSNPRTYPFDSKAKRIVELEGVTLAVIVANASASHGIKFSINFRILSQLRGTR